MRRSWLQSRESSGPEVQTPHRMRRSQDQGQVSAGSARPGRSSGIPTLSSSSLLKRASSVSRIPVAGTKVAKRSSSTGRGPNVLGERNSLMTPRNKGRLTTSRSSENLQTPLRIQTQSRPSLATGMSGSRRVSELRRASGRGSLIGTKTVKDTRELQDKKVQMELNRRLLDFLRHHQYPTPLTSKNLPPSSKEFVNIFNFIYSVIDVRNPVIIPMTKNEDDIVKVMKTLHYPGMLSKSVFKTIAPHSWPTVLGCLSYLCDVATIFSEKLLGNIDAICFPSRDEDGLPTDRISEDKLILDCLIGCYNEFNEGIDDFPDQMDNFKSSLMDNRGVDMDYLRSQQQQSADLEKQLQEINHGGNQLQDLKEFKTSRLSDTEKIEEVTRQLEDRVLHYKDRTKRTVEKQCELTTQIQALKAELMEQKGSSLNKSIGSHVMERNSLMVNEKRHKISVTKASIEEIENHNWDKEIKVSRARGELETTLRQVNSVLVQQDIKSLSGERLVITAENGEQVQAELNQLLSEAKTSSRKLQIEVENEKIKIEEIAMKTEKMKKIEIEKSKQVKKLDEEISKLKVESAKEEEALDEKLTNVKKDLQKLKLQERGGLEERAEKVKIAEEKLKEIQKTRAQKFQEGQDFLQFVIRRSKKHFEDCEEMKKKTTQDLVNQIQEASAKVKEIGKEMDEEYKNI